MFVICLRWIDDFHCRVPPSTDDKPTQAAVAQNDVAHDTDEQVSSRSSGIHAGET